MEKIVITSDIIQKESLQAWAHSFRLGTAGYRDLLNPDDFQDPSVPFNRMKVALMAEARARVLKRELGAEGLCLHVGGEVRFHTREFIDLVSRIYAAHGIRVRRRPGGKTAPIWYSSFGIFSEELSGGENFTASHSQYFKGGWKPMDEEGKQLLEMAGRIAEEMREVAREGTEISLAPVDSELIRDDFDITDAYVNYLKSIVTEGNIGEIQAAAQKGFKAFFATLGGSMAGTASEIFEKLGIPVGDECVVNFLYAEEDPFFHNIGMVDGVNHGVDPGKWQIYKNIGAQNILANRLANAVFIWDPDGDRFNMVTQAPVALSEKAAEMGLEVEPLPGDAQNVCVYFKPNQIYFMLTAWLLENLKATGRLKDFDWVVMETYPSSRSVAELAESFGVKVFFTPVGFKHFARKAGEMEKGLVALEKKVEDGKTSGEALPVQLDEEPDGEEMVEEGDGEARDGVAMEAVELNDELEEEVEEEDGVSIEDVLGQEHGLGSRPRILIMFEESGGAALGGSEFIKSRSGVRRSMVLKEKDGMQIGLVSLVLAAELFSAKSCFASYYLEAMEKYNIKSRYYHREDVTLFDESITDPVEREKAKAEGIQKRDAILTFFKNLAAQVRSGNMDLGEVVKILNEKQNFLEFESIRNIYWTGDGTFLEFPEFWLGVRASGTDAVMRYYMEGSDKYILNKVNRAIMSIE